METEPGCLDASFWGVRGGNKEKDPESLPRGLALSQAWPFQ